MFIRFKLYFYVLLLLNIYSQKIIAQSDNSFKLFDDSNVASIKITMDADDLKWMYDHPESDSLHMGSVYYKNASINEIVDSVGIRIRGNTSRTSQKKSFKLSFNTYIKGRKFYDVEKINLNGEHNDPSIARSKICWNLYQKIGIAATRASYAAVYINEKYYGVYLNVEHIDEEFVAKNFDDPNGNLWKCLYPADLRYLGPDPNSYKINSGNGRTYDLSTNKEADDYSKLAHFINIINLYSGNSLKDSAYKYIDISSVLKYFAMDVITGSWDDYWFLSSNYYLYHEPSSDKMYVIPYDYDNSFGVSWFDIDWTNTNPYYFARNNSGPRPLVTKILGINEFKNLYTHFLDLINNKVFKMSLWDYDLYKIENQIKPYAELDIYRIMDYGFSMDDFTKSYRSSHYDKLHVKRAIREYADLRYATLNTYLKYENAPPAIYSLDWSPKYPGPNDSIYVYASAFGYPDISNMKILTRPGNLSVIEEIEMKYKPVAGSTIPEENDRWVGVIPPLGAKSTLSFSVSASNGFGASQIYPNYKNITLSTGAATTKEILINEIMARNDSTISDENGEFDDWLELYNATDKSINLKGKFLTDSRKNLTKWQFKEDHILQPGDVVLVWCDDDPSQGNLHTNFKLSGDGEFVALVESDSGTFIDSTYFPEQQFDVSWGRDISNSNTWGYMAPTPGLINSVVNVEEQINLPDKFSVSAYPNPFNLSTTIIYNLNKQSDVKIEIFNLIGEMIWSASYPNNAPGTYKINWNGKNNFNKIMSSGIYIVKVNAGAIYNSVKLMLVK
ncbi:MAG: hypothetical protein CVV23_17130 [Ignavibacteriae bacterium HGW-Ignavibacteriae-2]|nr:MAG: hypothetical protein CVV23_17130 [Ignavibacteriae bacterium HGW-Ignavibacteriae-2]